MEDKANLVKRSRGEGCPTRLQKHAPASLDIDKVLNDRPSNPFGEVSKAIPLLSPLIVSPQPVPAVYAADITIQFRTSENENNGMKASVSSSPGWEHPAMASFPDSSSLCSFFQKQCVFVNHGQ